MPLNHTDQMHILKDILSNQQTDCCGTVAECEQMERIIKSLMINTNIDQNVKSVLEDIYSYSQNGKYAHELESHIDTHRSELSQWISDIDSFS